MREPASPFHPPGRTWKVSSSSQARPPDGTTPQRRFLARRLDDVAHALNARTEGERRPHEGVAQRRRPSRALRHRTPTPQRNDDSARVKSRAKTRAVGVLVLRTRPPRPPDPRAPVPGSRAFAPDERALSAPIERARRGRSGLPGFGAIGGFLQCVSLGAPPRALPRGSRAVATVGRDFRFRSRARRLLA
jgi:hypothetical protein